MTRRSPSHELIIPALSGTNQAARQTASLDGLVSAITSPYRAQAGEHERFHYEGPAVPLGGQTVTSLALVLHELATNAAKYGALSLPEGHIAITWSVAAGNLLMHWDEKSGPAVSGTPQNQGFGSLLARRSIEGQLGGALTYDWRPQGLVVHLSVPTERLLQ